MSALITAILLALYAIFRLTESQEPTGSCYDYGCGSFGISQQCQCNRECDDYSDCCSDFHALCEHGNFEECATAPLIKQDRRTHKERLRFASFNIEWLFLNYSHSMGGNYCPGTGCPWKNTEEAYEHLHTVARYLDEFDADIILLQETCDCWTIQQLINAMPQNHQYYRPYLLRGEDTATGQNVAMITKIDPLEDLDRSEERVTYPVSGSTCPVLSYSGTQGVSKHFRARFRVDGLDRDLTLFNFHFLAFPTDHRRCVRREGQATVIANMMKEEVAKGNLIIAAGDMNDYSSSVCDINCHQPISSVETILMNAGQLTNVVSRINPVTNRYSSWYNCNHDCVVADKCLGIIDQVMVSYDGLYHRISDIRIDHGFDNGCDNFYSDHWPYVIDFVTVPGMRQNMTLSQNA